MTSIFADNRGKPLSPGFIRRRIRGLDWAPDLYHGPIEMSGALPVSESRQARSLPRGIVDQESWDSHDDFFVSVRMQPRRMSRIDDLEYLFFDPENGTAGIPSSFYITTKGIVKAIAWAYDQLDDGSSQDDHDYCMCEGLWLFGGQAQQQRVVYPEDLEPFAIVPGVNDQFWAKMKRVDVEKVSLVISSDEEDSMHSETIIFASAQTESEPTPHPSRKRTRSIEDISSEHPHARRKFYNSRLLTNDTRAGRTKVISGRVSRQTKN